MAGFLGIVPASFVPRPSLIAGEPALPAPLLIFAAMIVGLVFAWAAFGASEPGRTPFGRKVWVPVFYQLLIVTPASLYLCVVHADWSWLYLVDPHRLPFGTTGLVLVAAAAAELGGYLAGWALLNTRRRREMFVLLGVAVVALLATLVALRDRLVHAGTFDEYRGGAVALVGERKLGPALTIIGIGMLAGLVLSVRFLIEQGEREREG